MSFKQRGSETRIYRISSDNKLDGMYGGELSQHNLLDYPKLNTKSLQN